MDDLAANWNNLSLSDKEQKGFIMRTDHQTGEYMLAALFLTPRFLLMDAVARTFKQLWRSTNGFKLKRLGEHKVLFVFDKLPDVDRIIQNQPWSFDKHLVVIQRYDSDTPAHNLIFNKATFWVQVHDIPLRYMTRQMAKCLCEIVGEVHKSTGAVDEEGGHFMRVRVTLDINLPLCRGRVITLAEGGKSWVAFKYERLPNLCYWCGRLDHDDKNCDLWIQSKGTLKTENQQFSSYLRVAPYTSAGKDVIFVPGYYENKSRRSSQSPSPAVVIPPAREVAPPPVTGTQPDMESEEIREELNLESVSKSNSLTGCEGVMDEVNDISIPNLVGSTLQPTSKPSTFMHQISKDEIFAAKIKEIDKEISKFDSPINMEFSVANQRGSSTLTHLESLNPTTYPFKASSLIPRDLMNPSNPIDSFISRDHLNLTTTEGHLSPHDSQHSSNPVTFNPTLTDVPISIISAVALPQPGSWKRVQRPTRSLPPQQGINLRTKRSSNFLSDPIELPHKRRSVSQKDNDNIELLAEAGQQPCQEQ